MTSLESNKRRKKHVFYSQPNVPFFPKKTQESCVFLKNMFFYTYTSYHE